MSEEELKKGCGKPINGDLEHPDWFCGDFLEENVDEEGRSLGRRYFCDECNKEEKEVSSEEVKDNSQVDEDNNSRKRFVYADTPGTQFKTDQWKLKQIRGKGE